MKLEVHNRFGGSNEPGTTYQVAWNDAGLAATAHHDPIAQGFYVHGSSSADSAQNNRITLHQGKSHAQGVFRS